MIDQNWKKASIIRTSLGIFYHEEDDKHMLIPKKSKCFQQIPWAPTTFNVFWNIFKSRQNCRNSGRRGVIGNVAKVCGSFSDVFFTFRYGGLQDLLVWSFFVGNTFCLAFGVVMCVFFFNNRVSRSFMEFVWYVWWCVPMVFWGFLRRNDNKHSKKTGKTTNFPR